MDNYKLIKYRGFLRSEGIKCLIYLGNNMAICSSKKETKKGANNNNIIINNYINNGYNDKTRKKNNNRRNRLKKKNYQNNAFWNKDGNNSKNFINQVQKDKYNIYNKINDDIKQLMAKIKLILFELKEKDNGKVELSIKKTLIGNYLWINCNKLLFDSYIICSFKNNNSLIKVDNEDLTYFLKIKSPFE